MTDKEKWLELVAKIEAIKDTQPLTYQLWQNVYGGIKEQIEQAFQKSEEEHS